MTDLLKKAFDEAGKLKGDEQDALAKWLLAELDADRQWDQAFEASQDQLASLAGEALREHREGRTHILDPDQL